MLNLVGQLFSPAPAERDYSRAQYALLALMLALGVWIRFAGLGNVGLHGDEETMAMPAMAILDQGLPYLPSGMFYPRALAQIYLMSASVFVFGESEWAFRLPSAIVGSLAGLAAFFMGRRFLSPSYNLAFVATIVFLPSMIEDSQTARMYVFLVVALMFFAACVFRWERDQRTSSFVFAVVAWTVALHFHTLAAFAAPLLLFPALSRESWRNLGQGVAGLAVAGVLFKLYNDWINLSYPDRVELVTDGDARPPPGFDALMGASSWFLVASIAAVVVFGVFLLLRYGRGGLQRLGPVAVVALALLAMALLEYHVGGILLMIGIVWWLRARELPRAWLGGALVVAGVLTAAHLALLAATDLYAGRQLIGALVGHVSVWPTLIFLTYAPLAAAVYGLAVLLALVRLSRGARIPIHFLFFAIAVWAQLLVVGLFMWDVPPRYTEGALAYFLLCAFAGAALLAAELGPRFARLSTAPIRAGVLAVLVLAIVNPIALGEAYNPSYGSYPDHKGAAEYIRNLEPDRQKIVIAEDVLQQTYYLGKVDYWLREIDDAQRFSVVENGRILDLYTATEVLGTGAELEALLRSAGDEDVYIIGTGEGFVDGVNGFRGRGIAEVVESDLVEVVYDGRDGKTKVWKLAR